MCENEDVAHLRLNGYRNVYVRKRTLDLKIGNSALHLRVQLHMCIHGKDLSTRIVHCGCVRSNGNNVSVQLQNSRCLNKASDAVYLRLGIQVVDPTSHNLVLTNRKHHKHLQGNYVQSSHSNHGSYQTYLSDFPQIIAVRHFHLSSVTCKDESLVEKVVKAVKSKPSSVKDASSEKTEVEAEEKVTSTPVKEQPKDVVVKKSLWERFVAEMKHYGNGFRLLFIDVRVCCKLTWQLLNGKTLSRRERKQQEKLKKQLKVKLEMAKFLQDTIEESALQSKKKKQREMAEQFSNFVAKIRGKGISVTTDEILYFSKLFEDEITLDNLPREQLMALCKVLNLPPLGTDNMLRFQLEMKLRQLKADDKMIQKEGIDSLSNWELQAACRARGMRALGVPDTRLKFQLNQWLDLHLNQNIPTSLLLLSRALYLPETLSATEQLTETISKLSDETTKETQIKLSEMYGEKIDNTAKLELIKQQQAAIEKEKQAQAEEEEAEKQKEMEKAEAVAAKTAMGMKEVLADEALELTAKPEEELKDMAEDIEDEKITTKDLSEIEEAIEEIAKERQFNIDKEELDDLKEDVAEYKEDLEDLRAVIISQGGEEKDISESKAAKRLAKRVEKLISQLDTTIITLHDRKDEIQTQIDVGEVKLKRSQELRDDEEKRQKLISSLRAKKEGVISINELLLALKRIQKVPDDTRLQKIVQVLDEDRDGNIDISHVLKVIELLGKENVKLESSKVSEIIDLIKQENILEEEEKQKEKLEKEKQNNNKSQSENSDNGEPQQEVRQEQS
ncbi:hypothetical protein FSP39_016948 [Pinctada imbricata]|uniref:Mitochondrial proton/calcium exchanger protein n=1 Tax=Pinctada imbricata TaxID=66713 RepID=A0AA88Y0W2_PINIB|nr:hypothetical protein FSP39_016948 [Pinctada imbricata]